MTSDLARYPDSAREASLGRRELGRLDTVCFLIAAIVVIDTLGAVSRGGAETLTWLVIVSVTFFLPAGLVIAELGAAFPDDGGPYAWARHAFGHVAGSIVALAYWVEAAVWVGGSLAITAVGVVNGLVVPLEGPGRIAFALAFVWSAVLVAVVPLRFGRRIIATGALAQVALLAFFTATVVVYAAREGVHGLAAAEAAPSWAIFILVAPVLVYNFLGFELPSAASNLRHPQRDIPAAIARAGAVTCLLYCIPVLAILLVVPAGELSGLTGFIDALAEVFTVFGAASGAVEALAGLLFVWVLIANGLTWLVGSSRAQAAACLEGDGPRALGVLSVRTGVPVRATLTAGGVATLTTCAAFAVAGDDNEKYFSVVLALSIALLALGNLLVFPALVRLRRSHPHVARPFRVPGGTAGAWLASGLATLWIVIALSAVLWPGLGTSDPNSHLPDGFADDRRGYVLSELVPIAAFLTLAILFAAIGARGKRRRRP